ncbi:DUF3108 domain-containing protein [uncultured Meiothermus sp.]|uniref:DUF3108 domain-containing protein n=1 Tax=uncultured Meiothermus sp. TaxID=157471 RepID=UPI002601D726|nr:DUF3108 domain-containing protein [uncultured Meiothermus sp.]
MFRGGWFVLFVLAGAGSLAQAPPWPAGERLTYHLVWQGIGVGRLHLSADGIEGGWRFRLKLETTGLAQAVGYGLESESQVGQDFYTDRFWQTLTEPLKGTTRLMFERQENNGSWARIMHPDGRLTSWSSSNEEVVDQLSLIYYLRIHPETRLVSAVDYPRLAQGRLEPLPVNGSGLVGYRLAREDLLVEIWYRQDVRRTPARILFGRDFGRLEATLIENGNR